MLKPGDTVVADERSCFQAQSDCKDLLYWYYLVIFKEAQSSLSGLVEEGLPSAGQLVELHPRGSKGSGGKKTRGRGGLKSSYLPKERLFFNCKTLGYKIMLDDHDTFRQPCTQTNTKPPHSLHPKYGVNGGRQLSILFKLF